MTVRVSVVLPVYNRDRLVTRAIESVFAQTVAEWELIVVDDGSTDGTAGVLEGFGNRVCVLRQANAGAYAARNLALTRARGEFIAFIDSDDVWYPDRLASQLPLFSSPAVALVFGDADLVDHRGGAPHRLNRTFFDEFPPSRGAGAAEELAVFNFIPQSSVMVRRSIFETLGGFSLLSPTSADHAKWLEIALHHDIDFVDRCVFEYALHEGNISKQLPRLYQVPALYEELLGRATLPADRTILLRMLLHAQVQLGFMSVRDGLTRAWRAVVHPRGALEGVGLATRLAYVVRLAWRKLARRLGRPGRSR